MKRRLNVMMVAVLALVAASPALADIALPRPETKPQGKSETYGATAPNSPMTVEADARAKEARLEIPRDVLQRLGAGGADGSAPGTAASTGVGLPPAQTIMMGLFLSLSLVTGGFWILRSRRKGLGQRATLVVAALGLTAVMTTIAMANAVSYPPPPLKSGNLQRAVAGGESLSGNVRVVIVPEGNQIKLIVPKNK